MRPPTPGSCDPTHKRLNQPFSGNYLSALQPQLTSIPYPNSIKFHKSFYNGHLPHNRQHTLHHSPSLHNLRPHLHPPNLHPLPAGTTSIHPPLHRRSPSIIDITKETGKTDVNVYLQFVVYNVRDESGVYERLEEEGEDFGGRM